MRVSELFQTDNAAAAVQDSHNGALGSPHIRQRHESKVEHAPAHRYGNSTVLGNTSFSDIKTSADLQVVDNALTRANWIVRDFC